MPRTFAAALTAAAVLWTAVLLLSPFALAGHQSLFVEGSTAVYQACGLICHQRPERSFHLAGIQLPVCARCFGLYASAAAGAVAAWLVRRRGDLRYTRAILIAAAIPTVVSVGVEFVGLAHPSSAARAVAALPLGAAASWMVIRMLIQETGDRRQNTE